MMTTTSAVNISYRRRRRRRRSADVGHYFYCGRMLTLLSLTVAAILAKYGSTTTITSSTTYTTTAWDWNWNGRSSTVGTLPTTTTTTATSSSTGSSRIFGITVSAFPMMPSYHSSSTATTSTTTRRDVQRRFQQYPVQSSPSSSSYSSYSNSVLLLRRRRLQLASSSKGFGGRSGSIKTASSSSSNKKNKNSKKQQQQANSSTVNPKDLLRTVQQKYGGSTPQQVAVGTQAIIDKQIQSLPVHIQNAISLYKLTLEWDRRLSNMDLLEQSQLPTTITDQHDRNVQALHSILSDHAMTIQDLQVTMQQITWDASADAKTMRSLMGTMSRDIEARVDRACIHVMEAITDVVRNDNNNADGVVDGTSTSTNNINFDDVGDDSSTNTNMSKSNRQRVGFGNGTPDCLDVGCGYGVLVPYLLKAGIKPSQILGVDLSSEMVRNAQSLYPDVQFRVANFMDDQQLSTSMEDKKDEKKNSSSGTQEQDRTIDYCKAVIFCASLHDLPDMVGALRKAKDLVHPNGGRLIVVHPQGASHVAQQHRSNPIMVPRTLPTTQELNDWLCNDARGGRMELIVEPAPHRSDQESREGYLAVLRKM